MRDLETLLEAAKTGDLAAVRAILDSDSQLASARLASGESPLMAALYRGQRDVVALLIDAGADLDVFAAAATGQTAPLKSAAADPAAVNSFSYDGWTPLHLAAFFGHPDAARILIQAGAELNAVSRNGLRNTPLHAATAGKHSDVALLLLAEGADPRVVDGGGYSATQIATENRLTAVVDAVNARRL